MNWKGQRFRGASKLGACGLWLYVAFASACGRSPEPVMPQGTNANAVPEYVLPRLCASAPPAAASASAALVAAEGAIGRGCPREALALLGSVGQLDAWPAAEREQANLLTIEAAQDASTPGFTGLSAAPRLLAEPWALQVLGPVPLRARLDALANARRTGTLPQAAFDSGRVARVVGRAFAEEPCAGPGPLGVAMDRRDFIVGQLGGALAAPGAVGNREIARIALFECDIETALAALADAASQYRAAGNEELALDAELDALEIAVFPGHRSERFGLESTRIESTGDAVAIAEFAALSEAGAADSGPFAERSRQLQAGLERLAAGARPASAANQARIEILRSVGALTFRLDAGASLRHAEAAVERAVSAKRADLLTHAVVARMLALAELGRGDDARATGRALAKLLDERGAVGPREHVAFLATVFNLAYMRSGRLASAVELMLAMRPIASGLAPVVAIEVMSATSTSCAIAGRLEEALDELGKTRAYWTAQRGVVPELTWTAYQAKLDMQLAQVEALLGLTPEADELVGQSPEFVRLGELIVAGDGAGLRDLMGRAIDRGDQNTFEAMVSTIVLSQNCTPVHELLLPYTLDLSDRVQQAEFAMQDARTQQEAEAAQSLWVAVRAGTLPVLPALAACGAMTGQEPVVTSAYQVLSRLGGDMSFIRSNGEAQRAEALGDFGRAATLYEQTVREWDEVSGLSAGGGVGTSQMRATFISRAVVGYLEAGRNAEAVRALEDAHGRDLRLGQSGRREASGETYGAYLIAEQALADAQRHARSVAQLARETQRAELSAALLQRLSELQNEVERREGLRQEAERRLRQRSDEAYRAAALAPVPNASDLSARLRDDETLVYFHLQPDRSWAIALDKKAVRAVRLGAGSGSPDALFPRISRYRDALAQSISSGGRGLELVNTGGGKDGGLGAAQAAVYEALVAPVLPLIGKGQRVLIVPDEHTAQLPFSALGSGGPTWGARNPLRVLPGGFLLPDRPPAATAITPALVVGDPEFEAGSARSRGGGGVTAATAQWVRLPGTRSEAETVAKILDVEPLLGAAATEEAVRARSKGVHILHLATHGMADPKRPSRSALILAESGSGDGILHAHEVEHLPLDAELVVLSACETGVGQSRGKEGVLALDRAFLLAGAGAVVSSLWVVDDDSTAALMLAMYAELSKRAPLDIALARAQASVRTRWPHPYFWSGFQVVGAGLR